MKKPVRRLAITLVFISIPFLSKAQLTNLIFFSEQGEHFSIVLNGILQNAKPETNIKITGLPAPSYKMKVIFEDPKIPEIDKTLMFQQGTETTFNIRKNNKGEYVIQFLSQVNISATTLTTAAGASGTMVVTDPGYGVASGSHYEMPGYHGDVGCPYPMTDLDFRDMKQSVASNSFEESKLNIAKQVASSNCLFSSEVKEIMELFSFESSRLEFAKFAYRYTFDVGNYYKVNGAFQFESSIEELNKYIDGKKLK
jgi:hypothetical protein